MPKSPINVLLGNAAPMMQVKKVSVSDDGQPVVVEVSEPAQHLNQSVTGVEMAKGFDDEEFVERSLSTNNDRMLTMIARQLDPEHRKYAVGIQHLDQLWGLHSAASAPAYVACPDDPEFEACVAAYFDCPQGEPTGLITSLGRDGLHGSHLSTSQPLGYTYMSVSANTTAESTATVSLPGEITTAGGTLIRGSATIAHTAGTNVTTASRTFTVNASDAIPVVIAKIGLHNASSGTGNTGYEKLLGSTATLNAIGDNVTVTDTITAG